MLGIASNSNVWIAVESTPAVGLNLLSLDFPVPKIPDGASIMEQFGILAGAALHYPKPTGEINLIRPDGTQPAPMGFTGEGKVDIPWGLNIDGNDDVWVANLSPRTRAVVLMAGVDTKGHPAGKRQDSRHVIPDTRSAGSQTLNDDSIETAGPAGGRRLGGFRANNNGTTNPEAATSAMDPLPPVPRPGTRGSRLHGHCPMGG